MRNNECLNVKLRRIRQTLPSLTGALPRPTLDLDTFIPQAIAGLLRLGRRRAVPFTIVVGIPLHHQAVAILANIYPPPGALTMAIPCPLDLFSERKSQLPETVAHDIHL